MRGRKMCFKRIFLPKIFLPDFQSSRRNAFFNPIVQFEKFSAVFLSLRFGNAAAG